MALVSFRGVSLAYGGPQLFDSMDLQIEARERVCLLGRNGSGKSTLLKMLAGAVKPDDGTIDRTPALRVSMLQQKVPTSLQVTVREVVAGGLRQIGETEAAGDREQVSATLSRMNLDPSANFGQLSAGMKRRVLLARALCVEPDLLLLDEPTNHLDIASITWLEDLLMRFSGSVLFVSHDRAFVSRLATRIVELDRGRIYSFPGSFAEYKRRREAALDAEERQDALFDKKLAQEEVWLRQGIKARRTRNEGRKRALERMRAMRAQRRERVGQAVASVQQAERSGKLVFEAKGLSVSFDGEAIVEGYSTIVLRGDKIGVLGENGCGKTTLVRALIGEQALSAGTVKRGSRLELAYFDQLRAELDPNSTVKDAVSDGNDTIMIDGEPRHIIGYLAGFLFPAERARSPVSVLSGGERNRLLLARLFATPSNLLILDEPTNDLDVETLELLEQKLIEYEGTVIVVSHDRAFLNNVVSATIAHDGGTQFSDYSGGYNDWLMQSTAKTNPQANKVAATSGGKIKTSKKGKPKTKNTRRLSFKEKAALEVLPGQIETLEEERGVLHETMADPAFYQGEKSGIVSATTRLEQLTDQLEVAYERWQELEEIASSGA